MLRDYQQEMIARIQEAWKTHPSVMVQMPTGTGKTHVLAAVIRDFLPDKMPARQAGVWIIAHRRELVAQVEETIRRYGIKKKDGQVRAFSIQWLARHWDDIGEQPSLIVIDEAHHALADTYRELWTRYPEARKLGMTATPCRMNHKGFTDLFNVLLTSWSIAEFIRKGQLSLFDYVSIRPGSEEQRLIDSLEKRGADGDYQLKELDTVLNRRPSIERLYESMDRYARNKKGIVYAISIDHARRIAAYYNNKGIGAVPIDSKTPALVRKGIVEDFKRGKIQVLVNVDVFSEGLDCPDVEFVQLARPTLSLSKYLQQVGRGLRKAEGKESCLLIDNVGLYRAFGLPTAERDWEAMFQGRTTGKAQGNPTTKERASATIRQTDYPVAEQEMEVVMTHDRLLVTIDQPTTPLPIQARKIQEMKARPSKQTGLWELVMEGKPVTEERFVKIFGIHYGMAAVRFKDNLCGIIDGHGHTLWRKAGCQTMKFTRNHLLITVPSGGKAYYTDLYSFRTYKEKPEIEHYGKIELLKTGGKFYTRTKDVYVSKRPFSRDYITRRRFYLLIFDGEVPATCAKANATWHEENQGYVCLLDEDYESFYWMHRWLDDESIIVKTGDGRYYHAEEGKGMAYIGCDRSTSESRKLQKKMEGLIEHAGKKSRDRLAEKEKKRQKVLNDFKDAMPFRSGLKWGLKVGGRITVPPIYRNVKPPVGKYCAVEMNYSQWGIIAVDGTVLVEPQYPDITISDNGTALLTSVTGKKTAVKLK